MTSAQVTLANDGYPQAITWSQSEARTAHRPRRVINVIDAWRYDGRWWEEQPLERDYYLVELDGGAQAEIFRQDDNWWVARIAD